MIVEQNVVTSGIELLLPFLISVDVLASGTQVSFETIFVVILFGNRWLDFWNLWSNFFSRLQVLFLDEGLLSNVLDILDLHDICNFIFLFIGEVLKTLVDSPLKLFQVLCESRFLNLWFFDLFGLWHRVGDIHSVDLPLNKESFESFQILFLFQCLSSSICSGS